MEHETAASPTACCNHYPNRVLRKRDLAREIGVCERTIGNLLDAGKLPEPCWFNSIPVWMLYDVHAFISAAAGKPRTEGTGVVVSGPKSKKTAKGSTAHKAGKYSA